MHRLWKAGTVAMLAVVWMAWATPRATLGAQTKVQAAKVDIVLERYQGDRKASSLPYSLSIAMSPNGSGYRGNGSVRIGVDVPIGTSTHSTTNDGRNGGPARTDSTTAPEYHNVGTQIDCFVSTVPNEDGRFTLSLSLSDTSIYDPTAAERQPVVGRGVPPSTARALDATAFRTFSFNNSLVMHDGQTAEFVNATDKVTGEVIKAVVTLTIAK